MMGSGFCSENAFRVLGILPGQSLEINFSLFTSRLAAKLDIEIMSFINPL
jgi:hypothetical protein